LLGRISAYRKQLGQPELAKMDLQGKSLSELREWADRLEAEVSRLFPRKCQLIRQSQPPAKPD
jgi:hypothetical protein